MKNNFPLIREDEIVKFVIPLFINSMHRLVGVVNDNNKLVGVLSEGDLLRYIIKGGELEVRISKIMTVDFVYFFNKSDINIFSFSNKRITSILLLNNDFTLREVVSIFDYI